MVKDNNNNSSTTATHIDWWLHKTKWIKTKISRKCCSIMSFNEYSTKEEKAMLRRIEKACCVQSIEKKKKKTKRSCCHIQQYSLCFYYILVWVIVLTSWEHSLSLSLSRCFLRFSFILHTIITTAGYIFLKKYQSCLESFNFPRDCSVEVFSNISSTKKGKNDQNIGFDKIYLNLKHFYITALFGRVDYKNLNGIYHCYITSISDSTNKGLNNLILALFQRA